MKCWKCDKEMDRKDGGVTLKGIEIEVRHNIEADNRPVPMTRTDRGYYNKQLGKYSNGKGECHVAICYECYIDGLLKQETAGALIRNDTK